MAAKEKLEQLRTHIDRIMRESIDVVGNANRIVFDGIQKLAEQELKALNDYYKSAVSSLKTAKRDNLKDVAAEQLDLMQDTVNKVISAARESLAIISETRAELARLVQQGGDTSAKALTKVAEPAQRAMEDVKKAAAKAQAAAAKTVQEVKKSVEKEIASVEKKGKAVLKEGKAVLKDGEAKAKAAIKDGEAKAKAATKVVKEKVGSVLDVAVAAPTAAAKAVTAKPSPESRAARAASKAKKPAAPATPAATPKRSTMPPRKR